MRDLDDLFEALGRSQFRYGFRLNAKDRAYLQEKGLPVILEHAADFIEKRLVPAHPTNDGKQTPWRGHPVFVAQHATGTCCRGCLARWHGIGTGVELTGPQKEHVISVIERWLKDQFPHRRPDGPQDHLFR
jgi:hypothetical protein